MIQKTFNFFHIAKIIVAFVVLCDKDSIIFFTLQEKRKKIIRIKFTKSGNSMFSLSYSHTFCRLCAILAEDKETSNQDEVPS